MEEQEEKVVHIEDHGIDVIYESDFLIPEEAQGYFDRIYAEADWHRPKMQMYGEERETRRQVAWHADEGLTYFYSGQRHKWRDWGPAMLELRQRLHAKLAIDFNAVLLNYYADGSEYVSQHSDDEGDMEPGCPIVGVSLGATRDFILKHRETKEKHTIPLKSGSLLQMRGDTQKVSTHTIPKRANVTEPRISLTFRRAIRQ
jgi:alkylated DNA repair dioxygenase AlkB